MGATVTYADLEIRILERQERGYPVEITFHGDQEFPRGFLDPAAQPQIDRTRPQESGVRMFQWLFASSELQAAWAQVRGQHPLRRIRLRIDATAPELHALPWELLQDFGDGSAPQALAAMEATPFSRYLAGQWIPGSPVLKRPVRILVAIANPTNLEDYGLTPIHSDEEWNLLQEAVAGNSGIELVRLPDPCTLQALEAALRKGIHILHFVGHGHFLKDSGHAVLYLADDNNRVAPAKDSDISSMLARQLMDAVIAPDDKLRLIHLSSCQTAVRNPADAFRGLAPQLVASGVPAVIAMQDVVPVVVAHAFSQTFYRELLDHGEVDRAANMARSSLLTAGMRGAAIPVLFMRLRFGQLFGTRRFGVFLSHNPADQPLVEELAHRLVDAGIQPWFDKWHLPPGTAWQEALEDALNQSSACAVFVGPGGSASWQNEQVRTAIDRRVRQSRGEFRVIPVLLPGAKREERSKLPVFLVATTWVEFSNSLDDDPTFYRLLCGIRGEEPGAGPGSQVTITGNPYRGLEPFEVEHQAFFFGREALVGWLLNALRTAPGATENRFLALIGPSGSGKSSLARAGLLAAIQRGELEGSEDWPIATFRPGPEPLESLAISTALAMGGEKTPAAIRSQMEEFRHSERTLHLRIRLAMSASPPQRRLVLLVDQFEEVFTQCQDQTARQALIDNLMLAATEPGGQAIVVLTLRADLYGECSAYPVLAAALSDHQVLIGPMQEAEQRRAIERPALLAGAEFERGLVNDLLEEVRNQPGSLPSLQYTLLELWQRREGRRLTHAAYQEIGKVAGALERRAEEVYSQFSEPERLILRRIFLRLVQSIEGSQAARRRVRLGELMPAEGDRTAVERVIAKLAGPYVRLLTMEAAEGPATVASQPRQVVDIAHEALIRSWPRLRQWMDEDQEFQLWQKRLNVSRQEWDRTDRHPDALLRGALLDEAKRWIETRSNDLNSEEKDFIEAGLFLQKMREQEELAQQRQLQEAQHLRLKAETERAEEQTRSARRLRKLALGLALLFLAAVGAAVFARRQMNVANSLALAAVSKTVLNADLRVLLALNAVAASHTRDAEEALYRAVQALEGPRFYTTGQPYIVLGMTFSPDSKLLATANSDNSVAVWNAQDGTRLGEPLKIDGGVENVLFRTDGALAVATSRGAVKMIDAYGKMLQSDIAVAKKEVKSLAFSSGGAKLAIGSQDFSAAIWDSPAGPLRRLAGHDGPVRAVAFSPDARYLLTASVDGTAIGWDPGSTSQVFKLGDRGGAALLSLAVGPSGKNAATGDASGRVRLWEVPSGRLLQDQRHSELKKVQGLAFSADGHTLASASQDGTLKLWDATAAGLRERLAIPCGAGDQAEGCTALSFMMDGHTLAVAGQNGEVRRYETNFDMLIAQASSMVDTKQISADDCMKYLQKACEAPGGFTRAK